MARLVWRHLTNKDLTSRVFEPKLKSSVQEARLKRVGTLFAIIG
jgi:hypothetical protein